jgi:hypothetical protein
MLKIVRLVSAAVIGLTALAAPALIEAEPLSFKHVHALAIDPQRADEAHSLIRDPSARSWRSDHRGR